MTGFSHNPPDPAASGGALTRLMAALDPHTLRRSLPPVERWHPPYCGEIDMRIAADGTWHYNGSPIARPALVRLFSTILRRDADRHVLVTPVECVGIVVEDAPFLAVEMAVQNGGDGRELAFRTNVDDFVRAGPTHPLRFERDRHDGVKPYLHVRGDLWALVTRALALDLVALAEERLVDGQSFLGVSVKDAFFPIARSGELGGMT